MAYQSLYRRYRPRRFAEVRGQADVVRALRNAVRDGRVGHAYLFSGPRGTGKTSTARILAKALNCTDLRDGEPCCACESCLSIEAGTSYDLQELDAASNNGVDAMRELIGKAALGSPGRTKVYILDEVHMLTTAASNTLLKTLEEPPGHVVFVLATTDPHKVLPTIRSRTQHFEFHLLPADELAEHVQWVIADAGLDADAEAVDYVLRVGGGSARDTLSALDQVVAAGGVLDRGDQVEDLMDALAANDTGAALGAVAASVQRGREPRVLGEALLAVLRDVFLSRMGDPLTSIGTAERERAVAWAASFTDRATTRALEEVGDALREMRQAPDPRIPLEVALVRLTRPDADGSVDGLIRRIERLEQALASDAAVAAAPEVAAPDAPQAPAAGPAKSESGAPAPPRAATPDAPTAPADAPVGGAGGRPADAARAALAARGAAPSTARPTSPSRQAPVEAPPAPPPPPGTGPSTAPERPAPTAAAGETGAAAGVPDRDALTLAWADTVLPGLKGLTKAMFAVGRFLDSTDAAVFALPGDVHRAKCEERRGEVEAALSRHFGTPVPLRLVVDGSASPAPPVDGAEPSRPARATPDTVVEEAEEVGDVRDLADAPADDRSHLQRLAEAFPGAEVVEEP